MTTRFHFKVTLLLAALLLSGGVVWAALAQDETPPMPETPAEATIPVSPAASGVSAETIAREQEEARALAETTMPQSGPVPQTYPLERYKLLWVRSPFLIEVLPPATTTVESPFKDYALTGIVTMGNTQMASFFNKAENKNIVVSTDPRRNDPFKLLSIQAGDNLESTTVQVSGSGQDGTISFDKAVADQRKASGGGGAPQAPNQPPQPPRPTPQAGVPNKPPPTPPRAASNNNQNTEGRRPRRRVIIPRQVPSQP